MSVKRELTTKFSRHKLCKHVDKIYANYLFCFNLLVDYDGNKVFKVTIINRLIEFSKIR